MIEWNREISSGIQLFMVVLLFFLLIIKRKNLGKGIIYFIVAGGMVVCIDTFVFVMRLQNPKFNSIAFYSIAINLFVFLLFFIYFYHVLEQPKSKKLSLAFTGIFLVTYLLFALFSPDFYKKFPYVFYIIEVFLMIGSIFLVLRETFNSDRVLNIKTYYPMWACIGLMSIYLGVMPLLIISNSVAQVMNIKIFFIILFVVNVVGYSILIIGTFFAKNIIKREPYRN